MRNFFASLFHEKYVPDENMKGETGDLSQIRNHIINTIYLLSGIFGTFVLYATVIRILKFGWQPFFVFHFVLFFFVWGIFIFRRFISLNGKSVIFFILFFILASSINYTSGILSGALNFVFITTLATLIFGWKAGVISLILTLIVRFIIGWCYLQGFLKYNIDLVTYANSKAAFVTAIMGGLVVGSITVFAINTFYKWLIISLRAVSVKADELMRMNTELLKAKQKAEENDRLKSVFLANMSHEIRTPMNAIIGFSGVLSKPNLSEAKRERYVSIIQSRSFDLLRIIEDILDISKIEVGQMKLDYSEFEISALLQEIYDDYKQKKEKLENSKGIDFTCFVPANCSKTMVNMDMQRLKQVFTNLLDNAFKFTSEGRIEFGCKKKDDAQFLFWVKDSGIGIPLDKRDVIFDRFTQADESSPTSQYGGTGLGLSIVQGIIELMNGRIWLESEVGEGTIFYFELPVR